LAIWTRWDEARAPFEIRRMNLRSRGAAARHILWSFFMGNAGLAVRCGQQIATIVLFDKLQIFLEMEDLQLGPFAAIVGALGWLFAFYMSLSRVSPMYYKIHRTLHENKTLYAAIHRIHHKGVYPTVLDAGTETPLELALIEPLAYGQCILPDWLYTALQIIPIFNHYKGHHSSISKEDRLHFHVGHHRLFLHNFGLTGDYPFDLDRAFGTLFTGKHDEMPVGTSTAETVQ
jgi:sterol desaturase/sphingolipid hydroxylase (fatty acid hydroxylase superfamily)